MRLLLLTTLTAAMVSLLLIATGCRKGGDDNHIELATSKNAWCSLTIIASKKGFFKEQGLDVELRYVQAAKFAMDALISGQVEAANVVETNMVFLAYAGNNEVEIVGTHALVQDGAIVARRSAGIDKPADLKGKKLGVLQGTTSQIFADRFLRKHNLTPNQVKIVNLQPVGIQSSLVSKDIDAGSVWEPFVHNLEKQLGDDAIVFRDSRIYTGFMNLAIRRDWGKKNAAKAEALLRAHLQAEEFVRDHPDEAIGLVADEIRLTRNVVKRIWDRYRFRVHLGPNLSREIRREAAWLPTADEKFKGKDQPDFSGAINPDYLKRVDEARLEK